MIQFNYETEFKLKNEEKTSLLLLKYISKEGFENGELNYIFCDDTYLHKINVDYLNHDTLTDIISFDYSDEKIISGDIFISVERVKENANDFNTSFENELHRVIVHGILHYMGYKDKSTEEKTIMRSKENEFLNLIKDSES